MTSLSLYGSPTYLYAICDMDTTFKWRLGRVTLTIPKSDDFNGSLKK